VENLVPPEDRSSEEAGDEDGERQGIAHRQQPGLGRWKAERMRDHTWVKEYMSGNGQHKRDMMLMNIVLTSPIKSGAAA